MKNGVLGQQYEYAFYPRRNKRENRALLLVWLKIARCVITDALLRQPIAYVSEEAAVSKREKNDERANVNECVTCVQQQKRERRKGLLL